MIFGSRTAGKKSLLICVFTVIGHMQTPTATATANENTSQSNVATRRMENFGDLRNEILNSIGGATKRIWLASEFLSDGEIVSALYVAQYRKVNVQVLLGRGKSNSYMSRLNYLKAQNIPVYLKPPSMRGGPATALLTDDSLITVNGELDFLARNRRFDLSVANAAEAAKFEAEFATAVQQGIPARASALPLVGRAKNEGKYVPQPMTSRAASTLDADGAYRYGKVREARPTGVPEKLPKATILQQTGRPHELQGITTQQAIPSNEGANPAKREPGAAGSFSESDLGTDQPLPPGINVQ